MYKTHTCGELRTTHAGQEIVLAGWVHRRRDHGGVTFFDLRDRFGLTQVVANPDIAPEAHAICSPVRSEWVIQIKGIVRNRPEGLANPQLSTGEIEVARIGISQSFTTCNRVVPDERIDIRLQNGPFSKMDGSWHFRPLREDACKVELELNFEFSGALISAALGAFFTQAATSMVDAFCKRADELYSD